MHFENLDYDFLLGDGTGGLSIWSLKNPESPLFVGGVTSKQLEQPAGHFGNRDVPADTPARFYEGENPTVDSRRKLAFLARDPRSFGNNGHPNGRTGLYIIDVKNPWDAADPELPLGPRGPHRDLHQRLPLPVVGRSGQQRLAASTASRRTSPACCIRSGPASRPS